jgi:TM2 domain-containing membrane protein YozV
MPRIRLGVAWLPYREDVPEHAEPDQLRVGTQEREDAVKVLGEHFADGRLPVDEYEERAGKAADAQTRGDLRPLFRDLPPPHPAFLAPPPARPVPPPAPVFPEHYDLEPMVSERYRVVAGVLQIVFPFGVGRFYTGHTGIAIAQLCLVFIGVGVIWSFIDGIVLLASGGDDADGRPLRI